MKRKTRRYSPVLFGALLVLFIITFFLIWYFVSLRPVSSGSTERKIFVIPQGQPTDVILQRLRQEGLVRSVAATKLYLYFSGDLTGLQAGSFRISPSATTQEVIDELKYGTLDTWVTVPEGWRAEQIVDELVAKNLLREIPRDELYQTFRRHEGKLFPDTYLFAYDSSPDQILGKMLATFEFKTADLVVMESDLVLASLVEREAKRDEDRPLIAGVLKNRLALGMPLQVDATLQYVRADESYQQRTNSNDWWPKLEAGDKQIDSFYNTYQYPGLPPRPIANPGLSSIKAVLQPTESEYLYYVSEPDGTTHYAQTLEEHNENIRRYLE